MLGGGKDGEGHAGRNPYSTLSVSHPCPEPVQLYVIRVEILWILSPLMQAGVKLVAKRWPGDWI